MTFVGLRIVEPVGDPSLADQHRVRGQIAIEFQISAQMPDDRRW
jgi:hypothetical protein